MKYNIFSVLDACEVFYVQGFTSITTDEFLFHFCKKFQLERETEEKRIQHMLTTLNTKGKIRLENDRILLHNTLTRGLRLVINDMEA